MRQQTEERELPTPISEKRLAEISMQMADLLDEIDIIEADFADAKEQKKGIAAKMNTIREYGRFIKEGMEKKPVICRVDYDTPEAGEKQIVRTDTNQVIDTLQMTDAEKQGDLFIGGDGNLGSSEPPDPGGNPTGDDEKG